MLIIRHRLTGFLEALVASFKALSRHLPGLKTTKNIKLFAVPSSATRLICHTGRNCKSFYIVASVTGGEYWTEER
jgi:hypothetical protein